MKHEDTDPKSTKTLGEYFQEGLRKRNKARPFSFYLLIAILIVVVLSSQMMLSLNNPKRLFFMLALDFVFLFAVLVGAIVDFFDISKRHFSEKEKLFAETFGHEDFVSEMQDVKKDQNDE